MFDCSFIQNSFSVSLLQLIYIYLYIIKTLFFKYNRFAIHLNRTDPQFVYYHILKHKCT